MANEKRPHVVGSRITENIKKEIDSIIVLESRSQSDCISLLLEEFVPLKVKMHDQKNTVVPIVNSTDHKERVLLKLFRHNDSGKVCINMFENLTNELNMLLDDEQVDTLIANLLIHRKENKVYGGR